MTNKLSKVTSIRKKFVQPGFIFSASYILFSADSCFGLARDALKQQQAVAHNHNNGVSENTSSSRANIKVNGQPKNLAEGASTKPSFSQPAGEAAQKDPTPVVPSQANPPASTVGVGASPQNNATGGTNASHANGANSEQSVPVANPGPAAENPSLVGQASSVDGQQPVPKDIENPVLTAESASFLPPLMNLDKEDTEKNMEHTQVDGTNLSDGPTNEIPFEDGCDDSLNCLDQRGAIRVTVHTEGGPIASVASQAETTPPPSPMHNLNVEKSTASTDSGKPSISPTGEVNNNNKPPEHTCEKQAGNGKNSVLTGSPPPPPPPMPEGLLTLPMTSFNVKKNTTSTADGQSTASPTGKVNNENAFAEELKRKLPPRIGDDAVESKDTGDGQSHSLNRENSMPMTGNTERKSVQNGHSANSAVPTKPIASIIYPAGSIPPPPPLPPPNSNAEKSAVTSGSGKLPTPKSAVHNITDGNVSMGKGQKQGTAPGGISNALQQSPFFQRKQSQLNDGSVSQENDASN